MTDAYNAAPPQQGTLQSALFPQGPTDHMPTPIQGGTPPGQASASGIVRGTPETTEERKALVNNLIAQVKEAKKKHEKAFKRMRQDMRFTRKQLPSETEDDDRPKVNIVQRHVKNQVAVLYAKNPTFLASRRKTLDYSIWDGKRSSLEQAAQGMAQAMQAGQPIPPDVEALLADVQGAVTREQMLDKVAKTAKLMFEYSIDEQSPPFKAQAKQVVRRTVTCGVGYFKLAFQRQLTPRPDTESRLQDITDRIAQIEVLRADIADGETDPHSAEVEELRLAQEAIQAEPGIVVREGLVIDYPRATAIIPFIGCTQLAVGFPGAPAVAEEFMMDVAEIKKVYGVDVGENFTGYTDGGGLMGARETSKADKKGLVWEIYHRETGLKYCVCDGYPDFLHEPGAPELGYIGPFYPFFPLVFNQVEDDEEIFPESDVRLLRSSQREINRKREGVRQHRIANRPLYVGKKGMFEEEDTKNLASAAAHDVILLEGMEQGQKVADMIQAIAKVGVDPNLYETSTDLTDVQLIVGSQEADLGPAKGDGSATQSAIASQGRMTSISSNADDLDDVLTELAKAGGQVLFAEMSAETVKQVCGPGATWPTLDRQTIAEAILLTVQAGSSGRPNKEQDLANLERTMPFLIQIPGIDPTWLGKLVITTLDARIDLDEAFTAGLPSVTTMNRQTQPGTGDPATDPNAQGDQGGQNAPNNDQSTGGAQPGMPAPTTQQPNAGSPV
jgi:hypothetical protein